MTPRTFRLVLYTFILAALISILTGCASVPTQPVMLSPAQIAQATMMNGEGPTDVHVMAQGLIIDLHVAEDYVVCVEFSLFYKCLSVHDLRAWLAVWQTALSQAKP